MTPPAGVGLYLLASEKVVRHMTPQGRALPPALWRAVVVPGEIFFRARKEGKLLLSRTVLLIPRNFLAKQSQFLFSGSDGTREKTALEFALRTKFCRDADPLVE